MNDYQKQHYFCDQCNKFTPHVPVPQKDEKKVEQHSPAKIIVFSIAAALIKIFSKDPTTEMGGSYNYHPEELYMCEKCGETTLV